MIWIAPKQPKQDVEKTEGLYITRTISPRNKHSAMISSTCSLSIGQDSHLVLLIHARVFLFGPPYLHRGERQGRPLVVLNSRGRSEILVKSGDASQHHLLKRRLRDALGASLWKGAQLPSESRRSGFSLNLCLTSLRCFLIMAVIEGSEGLRLVGYYPF
jgi:hypothetical protein